MSALIDFLQYLQRGDVTELVFQSGAAATAKKKGTPRPVTREPMSASHILRLVSDTPLESLVPHDDGASPPTSALIEGVEYVATVIRSGEMLLLRVRRAGHDTVLPDAPVDPAPMTPNVAQSPPRAEVRRQANEIASPRRGSIPTGSAEKSASVPSYDPPPRPAKDRAAVVSPDRPPGQAVHQAAPRVSYRPSPEASPLAPFVRADAPVHAPPALKAILADARAHSASDVHVMSGEPPRLRCGGRLIAKGSAVADSKACAMVMPLLNERNARQYEQLGYADFACQLEGVGRVRVNVNRQRTGIKACLRLIMDEPPTLESLGLPHELRQILNYHQGLVVISGPNGAGKTTTLAALVDMFNCERSVHIITVEDPVEVIHPIKKAIVSQREVGSHTKGFHSALKGSLREDPDVIAIGELRDRETVEKALEAAETGHLVFATMSTPSGASTIDRLIDMFPPDDQSQVRATLAGVLKFVVSQRLVPRKDGRGLVAASELLTGGMALWTLIRDDKLFQLPSLLQRGRGFGMIRIEDSLNELLAGGVISIETAKEFADDPRVIGQAEQKPIARAQSRQERGAKGTMRNIFGKKGR